jgi:hypothetical protein
MSDKPSPDELLNVLLSVAADELRPVIAACARCRGTLGDNVVPLHRLDRVLEGVAPCQEHFNVADETCWEIVEAAYGTLYGTLEAAFAAGVDRVATEARMQRFFDELRPVVDGG